ncbi:hypothetical protein IWW50_005818 [Coemansia erecta]|nr:hypothetical protein IWW50_005818 [Coemansia erecta]
MDGRSPAAAAILEQVIPYLDKKTLRACERLNKTWYTLVTLETAHDIESHILQLPLRIAHYRRKGLLGNARTLTVDIGYIGGFLSPAAYERRIHDAEAQVRRSGMPIRTLKVHAPALHTALSNDEVQSGVMAVDCLLRALPNLRTLDVGDCPVALVPLKGCALGALGQLRQIRWFSLGCNDLSSAAALCALASANLDTLESLDGRADVTDQLVRQLCRAPRLARLNASGSNISDDSLLALVKARGRTLSELVLSDCTRLSRRSIGALTPRLLPKLATLDLYNVMVATETYQALFNAQTQWPYLRDLKLKAAIVRASREEEEMVNDDILEAIARNCPRLVALRLFGCHGITDAGLSSILGNLGYLRELVVMHRPENPVSEDDESPEEEEDEDIAIAQAPQPLHAENGLLLSLPSISDIWASIPSLPANALASSSQHNNPRPEAASAPDTPCLSEQTARGPRVFTSQALRHGVRSRRFNLLNLDMAYDSVCAEHLARLSHLQVLCGRVITRHAKSLLESQFPKCKMMVWNLD